MKISIQDINSAGITAQAKIDGITEVTLLGTYDHPDHPGSNDWRIRIYDFGGVKVADTNGDPVWEETCPTKWLELMKDYEVIPRHYQTYEVRSAKFDAATNSTRIVYAPEDGTAADAREDVIHHSSDATEQDRADDIDAFVAAQ
jgi:hypothetical protein